MPRSVASTSTSFPSVKALAFDVFGTVVDWRTSIIREGQLLSKAKGLDVDWPRFADAWRDGYLLGTQQVEKGERPWINVDGMHRMILNDLIQKLQIHGLSEPEIEDLNLAWHRLIPWPDSVPGLLRLRTRFVLSTLSNGNVALLVNMAKNAGLPWDCVLSSEMSGHYKPALEVYLTGARLLGLRVDEVMMVAAHRRDLDGAKKAGLKTAFVSRPLEFGPEGKVEAPPDTDIAATDLIDLARKLGV
jgi:2-haloacid dehalogenase